MLRALLAAAAALAILAPSGWAQTSPSGSMLFSSEREGWPPHLYALNADGSGLKRLSYRKTDAEWSQAGDRIVALRPNPRAPSAQLSVIDTRTGAERLLVDNISDFSVSPSATEVAYVSAGPVDLGIVDVETGAKRLLVSSDPPVFVSWPDWSPSGNRIAFTRGAEVWIVNADGSGLRRLVAGLAPLWAPDGRQLLFTDEFSGDLFVINDDGTGRRRLAVREGPDFAAWSPDGSKIAFLQPGNVYHDAYVITADGSGLIRVAREVIGAVSWSPDGAWIALGVHGRRFTDIWIVRPDGRDPRRVTHGVQYGGDSRDPVWNSSGAPTDGLAGESLAHAIPTRSRVVGRTVEVDGAIVRLSADGSRAAYVVRETATQCAHPESADLATLAITAFWCSGSGFGDFWRFKGLTVELDRVTWVVQLVDHHGDTWLDVNTATSSRPAPARLVSLHVGSTIAADRGLVVLSGRRSQYFREPSRFGVLLRLTEERVSRIRQVEGRISPLAVGGGRIAARENGAVVILSATGRLLATARIPGCVERGAVTAAVAGRGGAGCRLRGVALTRDRLVVMRPGLLETYSPRTGALIRRRSGFPPGARLVDAEGNLLVYISGRTIHVRRLHDGRERVIKAPGRGRVLAQIEQSGLFYAYSLQDRPRGRVVFVPQAELLAALDR